jgi:ribosome biogenesis GTPase A
VITLEKKTQNLASILIKKINEATKDLQEKLHKKGIINPQLNVLVLGLPNVGKSTFINKVVKDKSVKTGNKPGLTRGLQRIQLNKNITLIDTPGIMPTVIESEFVATNLVCVNTVKEDIFPRERMASRAMAYIFNTYPGIIEHCYQIKSGYVPPISVEDAYRIFEKIAKFNK